jgi:predicted XRE-type DNA-binding protein
MQLLCQEMLVVDYQCVVSLCVIADNSVGKIITQMWVNCYLNSYLWRNIAIENMKEQGEIILYQPDEMVKLEVRLENEMIWLTQAQIANLFGVKQPAISKHLKNIFESGELEENSVYSILEYTAVDGKIYNTKFYNLDAILSVGYRVNSKNATLFRQWANRVLKDYLLKGYSINQHLNIIEQKMDTKFALHETQIAELNEKVDFFVRTSLPPVEGVFFEGQIFDAYVFVTNLIKTGKKSLVLIDNYVDETVLLMLSKRNPKVTATIYTQQITPQFQLDLKRHNNQYPPINVKICKQSHDRFLIIDGEKLYHIGASLKDLGKKWFAFSQLYIDIKDILNKL